MESADARIADIDLPRRWDTRGARHDVRAFEKIAPNHGPRDVEAVGMNHDYAMRQLPLDPGRNGESDFGFNPAAVREDHDAIAALVHQQGFGQAVSVEIRKLEAAGE